jgi:hypothetical protein
MLSMQYSGPQTECPKRISIRTQKAEGVCGGGGLKSHHG